jgi:predicted RNA-binding protein associated with RNAse of E/G family
MGVGHRFDITKDLTFEYTRLPDEVVRWRQWKLMEDDQVLVSAFYDPDLPRPLKVGDQVILEGTFAGISYNFWDQWYNVISVFDEDLEFKGYYTDILTPIQKAWTLVTSTDLFIDLFVFPDGQWTVVDEDEFENAREQGLMDEGIAMNARRAIEEVSGKARAGEWPPEIVKRVPANPVRTLRSVRDLERP